MDIEEIMRILAASGTVTTIHFHEGANIHDNQIDKLYTCETGSHAKTEKIDSGDNKNEECKNDPLFKVLFGNVKLYRDIVAAAGNVVRPSDFKFCIRPVLESHDLSRHNFNLCEFYEALIPHMTSYKCRKTVSAMLRSCEM